MGLFKPEWQSLDESKALKAVEKINNDLILLDVVAKCPHQAAKTAAISKISNQSLLSTVVLDSPNFIDRKTAASLITDETIANSIFTVADDIGCKLAVVEKVTEVSLFIEHFENVVLNKTGWGDFGNNKDLDRIVARVYALGGDIALVSLIRCAYYAFDGNNSGSGDFLWIRQAGSRLCLIAIQNIGNIDLAVDVLYEPHYDDVHAEIIGKINSGTMLIKLLQYFGYKNPKFSDKYYYHQYNRSKVFLAIINNSFFTAGKQQILDMCVKYGVSFCRAALDCKTVTKEDIRTLMEKYNFKDWRVLF